MPVDPQLKEIQTTNKKLDDIIATLNKGTLEDLKKITGIIKDNEFLSEKELNEIVKERSKFSAMVEGAKNAFINLTTGMKGIGSSFKGYMKSLWNYNSLIGKTYRAGATIWKEIHKNIERLFDKVMGHVRDVLGPIYELFNYAWETVSSLFKSIKAITFDIFFKKTPKHAKETNKHLKSIDNRLKPKGPKGTAGKGGKGEDFGLTTIIGVLITGAIMFLGGMIKKIILPFQAIWFFLTKIPFIGKLIGGAGKIFAPIINFFRNMMAFLMKLPIIGKLVFKLFKWFKLGMRYLGWPIQIIMSVIDFIKGFTETKGDLLDKIIGGLKTVFLEFLDLPIDAIGWIVDKILGFFGIEGANTADKIKGWISFFFDNLAGWLRKWWGVIDDIIDDIKKELSPLWNGIKVAINGIVGILKVVYETISEGLSPVINTVSEIFISIVDYFKNKIVKRVRGLLETLGIHFPDEPAPTAPTRPETPANEIEKKKNRITQAQREREDEKNQALQKAADSAKEAALAAGKASANTSAALSINSNRSGGGGDIRQTPDEIDSAMGLHNMAMEFNF